MNTINQPSIFDIYLKGLEILAPNGKAVFDAMPTLNECCQYQVAQIQKQLESQHNKHLARSAHER